MQSQAKTVKAYLAELAPDRRAAIEAVRAVILKNLDKDFEEGMQYGMIAYYVPHRVFPQGYHCDPSKPLGYAGLASQKQYISVYLMGCYGSPEIRAWFEKEWKKTGKKLDLGGCCLRFKSLEDAALDVIGGVIGKVTAKKYVEEYLAIRAVEDAKRAKSRKASAKKAGAKKAGGMR